MVIGVDFDNTLYDWVGFFVPAIFAMLAEAARILSVDLDTLVEQLRLVNTQYDDTEHPFALLDTPVVTESLAPMSIRRRFVPRLTDKTIT